MTAKAASWRRGATAVEFALMMPVLFTMAAGVATYAWYFLMQASITDAVTEGARRSASYIAPPDLALPGGDDDGGDDGGGTDGSGQIDSDDDEDDGFGAAIRTIATQATLDAAERSGWDPNFVNVDATLSTVGGISMLTIRADADASSRFGGVLFPIPSTVSAEITVATMDQP